MICAEEFAMADEAFALSPISARAAQPSEQDYEAISEAFMETSRGRWFLGEYARRNRNADTRMVLDAVERIEQSLAAQGRPCHQGDRLALARDRRRRPDLRPDRFAGCRHRGRLRTTFVDRGARRLERGVRPDRTADRGIWRQRCGGGGRS